MRSHPSARPSCFGSSSNGKTEPTCPHSDKYLVLIAYVIGISIAVHLLNLLCIPAIVLVIYYRKWANPNAKGSLIALLISFVIVALILYGLVPGFIAVAQKFELLFTNSFGMSFNTGTLVYAILLTAIFVWAIAELYRQKSKTLIAISFTLMCVMSGIFMIGGNTLVTIVLIAALAAYLFIARKLPTASSPSLPEHIRDIHRLFILCPAPDTLFGFDPDEPERARQCLCPLILPQP